jgi:SAM-dependent methyltransferase
MLGRFVGEGRKRKILEVGCSTGSNLRMLQDYGTVHAMELHGPAVEYCRMRFPGIRIYDGGIPDPLRDVYDVICLFDVLEHIEDEAGALEWIDDHLAPEGVLLVTVPAYDFGSSHDAPATSLRLYAKSGLKALLGRRFDVAYVTCFNAHLLPVLAAGRLIQRLWRRNGETGNAVGGAGFSNVVLQAVFAAERLWIPTFTLPFGVSIFAAARRRKDPACAA